MCPCSGDLRDGDRHVSVCSHHVCVCLAVDHSVDGLGSTSVSAAARQLEHQHYQPLCIGECWGFSFLFLSVFQFCLVLLPLKDRNGYSVLILLSSLMLVVRAHVLCCFCSHAGDYYEMKLNPCYYQYCWRCHGNLELNGF